MSRDTYLIYIRDVWAHLLFLLLKIFSTKVKEDQFDLWLYLRKKLLVEWLWRPKVVNQLEAARDSGLPDGIFSNQKSKFG
jgi:hypothetical protein